MDKKIFFTIWVVVLVLAVISVVGGVWYYKSASHSAMTNPSPTAATNPSPSPTPTSPTSTPNEPSQTYTNSQYGFQLSLLGSGWQGYKTVERTESSTLGGIFGTFIAFEIPTNDHRFAAADPHDAQLAHYADVLGIYVFSPQQWTAAKAEFAGGPGLPTLIAQSNTWVYATTNDSAGTLYPELGSQPNDWPVGLDIRGTLNSFKIVQSH